MLGRVQQQVNYVTQSKVQMSCGIKFPKCEILRVLGSRDQWTQLAYVKFVAWVV